MAAIYVPLPEKLAAWQPVKDVLEYIDDERIFGQRLFAMDRRVLRGEPALPDTQPISVEDFNKLVDSLRPSKPWAIRPSLVDLALRPDIVGDIQELQPAAAPQRLCGNGCRVLFQSISWHALQRTPAFLWPSRS